MRDGHDLAGQLLAEARRTFLDNVREVSVDEALDPAGGYRSVLGIAKHVAGWSQVYHSHAFGPPRHWDDVDWPRGLRERIEPSPAYVGEIVSWFERSAEAWVRSVAAADLSAPAAVHWGGELPLGAIVVMVAGHWSYHAGEINALLAIVRREAWEYGEEVEENHIATAGHGVRPAWMSDDEATEHEGASGDDPDDLGRK